MNRERELFFEALERPTPAEREAFLRAACGADAALLDRVMELLRSNDRAGNFLGGTATVQEDQRMPADVAASESPGSVIGRYKLLQVIGEGGFGRVYMAEQREPVKRKVALKIIKLGMDTRQVVGRFEAERQALAMMEHPHIARVLDGGATDTGRPYFVMELVRGVSITQFCDEHQLTTTERLGLFRQVCDAIHHAHQKGVIHRDIKPSNVLITMHDDRPVPKVIDFGIAKAIGQDLTDKTIFTRYHEFLGTPAYMSPEQTQLNGLDLDTRSDIYALGVLLYELLTGRTPFDAQELLSAGYDEIRRRIREDEPLKPSTRLHTLSEEDRTQIARRRKSDPRELRQTLKGELDWIVLKALEKDRARRYESAAALAHDIEHYLKNETVTAVAPSVGYRFRKFAQRHRTALMTALAVIATLVAGTIFSAWLAVRASLAERTATMSLAVEKHARQQLEVLRARAEEEANRARTEAATAAAVTRFLNDLFAAADPEKEPDREITLRSLLDRAGPALQEGHLTNRPLVAAAIHSTVGTAYRNLCLYTPATEHLQKAYDLRRRELGDHHPQTLEALIALAGAMARNEQGATARPLAEDALRLARGDLGPHHPLTVKCLTELAWIYYGLRRETNAFRLAEEAYAAAHETTGVDDGDWTGLMYLVGRYRGRSNGGDFSEGEAVLKSAWERMEEKHGPRHLRTLQAQAGVAAYYYDHAKKLEEAERILHDLLAKQLNMLGESHRWTVNTHDTLGLLYRRQNRPAEALHHFIKVLEFRPRDERALGMLPSLLEDPSLRSSLPSLADGRSWRVSTNPPPSDWRRPGFDDESWEPGVPPETTEAWFRNEFDLSAVPDGLLVFKISGAGHFAVSVNGAPFSDEFGPAGGKYQIAVNNPAKKALRVGRNVVAIHGRNLRHPERVPIEVLVSLPPPRDETRQ